MKNQDLSKIDFAKCKLPEWQFCAMIALRRGGGVTVVAEKKSNKAMREHVLYRRDPEGWHSYASAVTFAELDQLKAICATVDAFIETELDKLNAPEWVEVKWTEVARISDLVVGVAWRYRYRSTSDLSWKPARICAGYSSIEYQVDLKTVPAGVELYEPEWVEVDWRNVRELHESGARVQFKNVNNWEDITAGCGGSGEDYRADRKTLPTGWEPTKPAPVKPAREVPKCWESVDFDSFAARTNTGLDLVLDTSITAVYLCSKETKRRIMRREYDSSWQTDDASAFTGKAGMDELFWICEQVDKHIDKALTKPEPAWLQCTREEAGANRAESETRSILDGKINGVWRGNVGYFSYDLQYQYRTRAKIDRWVMVPWGDVGELDKASVKLQYESHGTGWSDRYCVGAGDCETSYRADRSTLPANYVLGVGFVETEPTAKTKTIREKVYEKLAQQMRILPDQVKAGDDVDALIDVIDEEPASKE